jgi:hypothetical protein
MNNSNLTLIDGEFSPVDAKEILKNVFGSKIQFHEMKNFSSKERFGKEDQTSLKRIVQLNNNLERILKVISEAEANNETLIVDAEICIRRSQTKNKPTEPLLEESSLPQF